MGAFRNVIDLPNTDNSAQGIYGNYTNYMLYRKANSASDLTDYSYAYCTKEEFPSAASVHPYDKCNDIEYYSYSGYFGNNFPEASISGIKCIVTNTGLIGIFYNIGNLPNIGASLSTFDRMILIVYDILYSPKSEKLLISDVANEDRMQKPRFDHDGASKDFVCSISSDSKTLEFYKPAPVFIDSVEKYVFFNSMMYLDGINGVNVSPNYGDYFCGIDDYPNAIPSDCIALMPKKEYSIHIHCDAAASKEMTAVMSYGTSFDSGSKETHDIGAIQSDGSLDRSIFYKGNMANGSANNNRLFIKFSFKSDISDENAKVYLEVR